ncbi:MAG: nickel pincer cofactor biosynthesis protein LarC [Pirellulales bacterium]|nr:nickel pincer cofactor biosynthesis protein LarC [Pirellulales bacterium]
MRIAYLDCASGISGDMMLGALVDAGLDLSTLNEAISSLGLAGCRLAAEPVKKKGFRATQVKVEYPPEHAHRHLHHIVAMIDGSRLTERQRDLARRIFTKLAEAEAKVHGTTVQKVHFHEVGAADSIADIVGSAVGWDLLGVDRIVASPVPTGCGKIRIAHGECSVPAPATAELLVGMPLAESSVPFELTTPTGAAILATMVDSFGPVPAMKIQRIGYGAGQRELETQPNLLRLLVGETADSLSADQVWVLETNLDDISGELVGYATARLLDAGALDVYTTAIQMKKNRPAVKLTVLCQAAEVDRMEAILFEETTTLGVRRWPADRHVLNRRPHQVETPWGRVEGKIGWAAGGPARFSPEFESCRRIAAERHLPLRVVYEAAQNAYQPEPDNSSFVIRH